MFAVIVILVLLIVGGVAAIVVPVALDWISIADMRDGIVVAYGLIGIIFFLVATAVAIGVGLGAKALFGSVKGVIDDSVKPTLGAIRQTAETIKGTTEFVGQTAVNPIVRTYGMVAGVKRGMGVLAGLRGKKGS